MVSDIIIFIVIVMFIILGAARGLARTLLNFAGLTISSMIANAVSGNVAQWIYDSFIKQGITENIQSMIAERGAEYAASNSMQLLPDWIREILNALTALFNSDPVGAQQLAGSAEAQTLSIAEAIEKPLGGLAVAVIALVVSFLLFWVLFALCQLIIRPVAKVFDVPVVSQINRVLGGIVGAVEGVVFAFFAVNLIYVILAHISPNALQNDMLGEVFRLLCVFD